MGDCRYPFGELEIYQAKYRHIAMGSVNTILSNYQFEFLETDHFLNIYIYIYTESEREREKLRIYLYSIPENFLLFTTPGIDR